MASNPLRSKERNDDETDELVDAAYTKVGTVLDDIWKLDAVLGVGATAAVYAARRRNGQQAAIKLLHTRYTHHENVRARLRREARVSKAIDHPGAVAIRGQGSCKRAGVFLVMELLEGETLDSYSRRRGTLPANEALRIAYFMLDVLAKAHSKGIIHRDVKPENVFLTRTGHLKLLDFGVAGVRKGPSDPGLTGTRTLLGTPGFMAPEQALALHDEVDARSDVWSVGATVFTLLTNRSVHLEASTGNELLIYAATKPAPSLATVMPDAAPELVRCVDRALAFDKEDRWPSARAMQDAIRALLAKASPAALDPPPSSTDEATSGERRRWWGAPKFSWPDWLRLRKGRRPSLSLAVLALMATVALCGPWACGRPSSNKTMSALPSAVPAERADRPTEPASASAIEAPPPAPAAPAANRGRAHRGRPSSQRR
jgi:serine/threonine-protein kinase